MKDLYIYEATVLNVVDGDTMDLEINVGFHMTTVQRVRLLGVDTPERNQTGYIEAKQFALEQLLLRKVLVHTVKTDVFGRYLATIFVDDGQVEYSFNDQLIQLGYAKPYVR